MPVNQCPLCGSKSFYVKDPADEYETYELELQEGGIVFEKGLDESEVPGMFPDTETFCSRCSWHGPYRELKEEGKQP
jgi:hypothetical protein